MSTLTLLLTLCSVAQPGAEISIDVSKTQPISPYIYGVNYPDTWISDWLRDWPDFHTGFALAREGGNRFTAYNWETNASNAGNDYYFQNDDYLGSSDEPGWTVRKFLEGVQATGTAALLTVPTLGYVAADKGPNTPETRDVIHTPDYIHKRFLPSYAAKPGGHWVYPPDTKDGAVYQDEFVAWVEKIQSGKTPVWFSLDNEPDLWHSTHLRLMPNAPSYADIITNNIVYAAAIKRAAPKSLVFGPSNYGWAGFRNFQGAPDANGRIFVDAYLDAMRAASLKAGKRLLDVYDFHWYPEAAGGGVRIIYNQAPDKPETEVARIQAPRSLWDPTYNEHSWINGNLGGKPIALLPDMQARVSAHYPGTRLAISEYDFGGRDTISGALAQADALGAFGRYGLFAACHWGLNAKDIAAYAGFRAFTDFDRAGSHFGDLGLAVLGEDPSTESVYAASDSRQRGRITIVAINKTTETRHFQLHLSREVGHSLKAYQVRDHVFETPEIVLINRNGNAIDFVSAPRSITTIELK